mgnify:CR=1 FL=1
MVVCGGLCIGGMVVGGAFTALGIGETMWTMHQNKNQRARDQRNVRIAQGHQQNRLDAIQPIAPTNVNIDAFLILAIIIIIFLLVGM